MTASDEPSRIRGLKRMRLVAGGLLLLMAALFALSRWGQARYPALAYLEAFAEAAMIGGLADWFAVTALFRHPFGLPVPHTAIIPRNKERIGASLGDFIANNFLSPEVMPPKVRALGVSRRLAGWLADEANARFVARRLGAAIPPLVRAMQDEPVRRLLRDAALTRLHALDAGRLVARLLRILMAGGRHLALFDYTLGAAGHFVQENQEQIRRKIGDKSAWWVPEWIDDKLAKRILAGIQETLVEMRQPDHPWRDQFQEGMLRFVWRLLHAPETRARAEAIKNDIVAHPEVVAYIESLWVDGKRAVLDDLAQGTSIEDTLTEALTGLAERLGADHALREVVDSWINRAVLHIVVPNRQKVGAFIAGIVGSWDTRTLVGKLELQVGRDLQYIRVNGTVVGGLVGLALRAFADLAL